jgi:hypothetical protein
MNDGVATWLPRRVFAEALDVRMRSTSGHAVVEIARALDQLFRTGSCLLDHRCGDAPSARDRRLLATCTGAFPAGAT